MVRLVREWLKSRQRDRKGDTSTSQLIQSLLTSALTSRCFPLPNTSTMAAVSPSEHDPQLILGDMYGICIIIAVRLVDGHLGMCFSTSACRKQTVCCEIIHGNSFSKEGNSVSNAYPR